jgi:hypothetical protein
LSVKQNRFAFKYKLRLPFLAPLLREPKWKNVHSVLKDLSCCNSYAMGDQSDRLVVKSETQPFSAACTEVCSQAMPAVNSQ